TATRATHTVPITVVLYRVHVLLGLLDRPVKSSLTCTPWPDDSPREVVSGGGSSWSSLPPASRSTGTTARPSPRSCRDLALGRASSTGTSRQRRSFSSRSSVTRRSSYGDDSSRR